METGVPSCRCFPAHSCFGASRGVSSTSGLRVHNGAKMRPATTPHTAITYPTQPHPYTDASCCSGSPAAAAPSCPVALATHPAVDRMFSGTISRENSPIRECGGNEAAPIAKKRIWSSTIFDIGSDASSASITDAYASASGVHTKLKTHMTGPRRPLKSVSDSRPPTIEPANPPTSRADNASPPSSSVIPPASKMAAVQLASAIRITITGMYAKESSMNDGLVSRYWKVSTSPGASLAAAFFLATAAASWTASAGDDANESFITPAYPSVSTAGM
mmetsp:Transcript_1054/g.3055  ORF Transcript_1054/g.3055 Transcript_1054/m.3055 type:complete len:275 (-) Transcript_1054:613-1437(-)